MKKLDPFYNYYQREMNYLRYSGAQFAQKYPKIARRLDFSGNESSDPHVERLLESFSYLTARLQRDIDDQFPRISDALLNVIYPHFTHPIPSMTVAQFEPHDSGGKLTQSHVIPTKTPLFTRTTDGTICKFSTVYPVNLVPIKITHVEVINRNHDTNIGIADYPLQMLKITLQSLSGTFAEMNLKQLRFYLSGNRIIKNNLLEGILTAQKPIIVRSDRTGPNTMISPTKLEHVGFETHESILPYTAQTHAAYRLLFEYFHYENKFFFIDLVSSDLALKATEMEILIPIHERITINPKDIGTHTVRIGCTPLVNLFHKTTEPIFITHQSQEYKLIPDQNSERSMEIFSIEDVIAAIDGQEKTEHYAPYYSYNYQHNDQNQKTFWFMRRTSSQKKDVSGTDAFLTFVDLDFNPVDPPQQTIYAKTLCTNRDLATHIPPGSQFYPDGVAATDKITCIDRPTPQLNPTLSGENQWRIISHLGIDHMGIDNGQVTTDILKEILHLYIDHTNTLQLIEIEDITNVDIKKITKRISNDAWRGFTQGYKITIAYDESNIHSKGIFALSCVLNRFFSLMASVNSFTQLEIRYMLKDEVWFTWPALIGDKKLL